jgi:ABC-type glutathione transport system ATPase component
LIGGTAVSVRALESVSFSLHKGSSIAFVGESGSGKSTLAACICRLVEPDSGSVMLDGEDLLRLSGQRLRNARSRIHMVFQDSATAFNPGLTAAQVICEPMVIRGSVPTSEQAERARHLMERVGLPADSLRRSPLQFSGGQRQRLAIARALAADAKIIIFDESLSGLDMSVQADVANLLLSVQAELALAYIFISHDIELAACLAKQIAVMSEGRIVEQAPSLDILARPGHAQTRALVGAILPFEAQA